MYSREAIANPSRRTYKMISIAFWTDLEGHVGLWVACFPALQPLVRISAYRLGLRSNIDSSARAGPSGQRSARTPQSLSKSGYLGSRHDVEAYDGDSSKSSGSILPPRALQLGDLGEKPEHGIRRDVEFEVYSSRVEYADDDQALRRGVGGRPWE